MAKWGEFRKRARAAAMPALCVGFALYLAYHTVEGDRSLVAWMRLDDQVKTLAHEVAAARHERLRVERRVTMLRPDSIDPDLLEERARAVLNLGYADDRIILRPGKSN